MLVKISPTVLDPDSYHAYLRIISTVSLENHIFEPASRTYVFSPRVQRSSFASLLGTHFLGSDQLQSISFPVNQFHFSSNSSHEKGEMKQEETYGLLAITSQLRLPVSIPILVLLQ